MSLKLIRLLTNPDDAILNGEDRQRSKASAPGMARLEPTWMYLWRLYDLPVLSVAGTLSITSMSLKLMRYINDNRMIAMHTQRSQF
ncbi:acetyltransferase [Yersinia pseudotuberculosis]|nr:acetyltransferase [Yersinia pseudotuberculosis]